MKKFFLMSIVMLMLALSCNGDSNIVVVINEDGTTSNGSVFSAIDDESFYLDYISYWIEEGHLVVTGCDEDRFKGVAEIPSRITYKGNTYEVLSIAEETFRNCDVLTSVTIPNSVTSIERLAFRNCSGLTSVTIGNGVTIIGDGAFWECSGLTSVTIGNGVTSIEGLAFRGCSSLTSVTIPNSVTSIEAEAFSYCSGLTSVTIPNSVTSIGDCVFMGCDGLTSIKVGSGNTVYDSRDNCNAIIESSTNTLISGCKNTTIPNSVTGIGEYAFCDCDGLTSVTIPNSVTSIGAEAFSYCSLTSVTIPNSVTSIGELAFWDCSGLSSIKCMGKTPPSIHCDRDDDGYNHSLFDSDTYQDATLYVPQGSLYAYKNAKEWGKFKHIEEVTFSNGCIFSAIDDKNFYMDFIKYTVEKGHLVVTGYDEDRFKGVAEIASRITYKGNTYEVTSIGEDAFSYCSGLTSVTIPNSVTSIGQQAFFWCRGLTSVTIGNSVTSIGQQAFQFCSDLTSVTIGNSVTSIGLDAFACCDGLTSVTIPNSVTSIGEGAFSRCSGLTSLTIPNSVTSIGGLAFMDCSGLTSVTIPNSVASIGTMAFGGCSGLTSLTIPNSVTSIGEHAFEGCRGLTSIKVGSGNTVYDSRDNCNAIIESSTNTLIFGCKNTAIPNSVKSIGDCAFCECDGLTSVTIPNSVTSIGDSAFMGCGGLTSVTIPNSVTSIGAFAFQSCSGLTSIKCIGKTPPLCDDDDENGYDYSPFDSETYEDATLYVPKGSLGAYKHANGWSSFKHIVER